MCISGLSNMAMDMFQAAFPSVRLIWMPFPRSLSDIAFVTRQRRCGQIRGRRLEKTGGVFAGIR
jgi:hypothetical protein